MRCSMSREDDRAARYVAGELSEDEREAFELHFLECTDCLALMQALAELPAVLREPQQPAAAPARRWRPIGLAALAAAAVFALWLGPRRGSDDPSALRGGAHVAVELLPATTGVDGGRTFAWTPLAAATSYRVELFSEDGRPVWTREVGAPPARWPADVPRTAGRYRWRVEALAAGAVVARSRLADVEIAR